LTASCYLFRVTEVTLLGQSALGIALAQLLLLLPDKQVGATWTPAIVVVISLAMSLWWKFQNRVEVEATAKRLLEILFAFAATLIVQLYLPQAIIGDGVITAALILTAAWTVLGVYTRSWPIASAGQMFLIVAWGNRLFAMFDGGNQDVGHHSLQIIGVLLTLAFIANLFSKRRPEIMRLRIVPHLYQWAAALLTVMWVRVHVPDQFTFVALAILFAVSFAATLGGFHYAFGPGVMLAAAGLLFWTVGPRSEGAEIQNLLAVLIIGASQFVARRKSENLKLPESAHQLWIAIASVALWGFISRWVIIHSSGAHFYLTASWAVTAFILFGAGFLLRELVYRWTALAVLACALARVVMLDVWKLDTLYRILSFFALGIVLLALGYVYTRQGVKSDQRPV
jgi:hypothetical protein